MAWYWIINWKVFFFIRCHNKERRIREQPSVLVHLEVNNRITVSYLVLFSLDSYYQEFSLFQRTSSAFMLHSQAEYSRDSIISHCTIIIHQTIHRSGQTCWLNYPHKSGLFFLIEGVDWWETLCLLLIHRSWRTEWEVHNGPAKLVLAEFSIVSERQVW